METMALPGLERLLEVCRRLGLDVETCPPRRHPWPAGTLVAHHPLDPMLAAFYTRSGQGIFATRAAGLILARVDDSLNELERDNAQRAHLQSRLALPVFFFGGEPFLAYYYATVPSLADKQSLQPVVMVDAHELDELHVLPVASNVDCFFDTWSRYLEQLVATPGFQEEGDAVLTFPWKVPHLLARDARLVELIRAGRFDSVMPQEEDTRRWVRCILEAAGSRQPPPAGR